ncbi:MAG: HPr(Ser) kinase/phosphatase, partial [Candidatus Krumholzibacteria bacterium]|nr:HPr(Ser) kinase/phosphatase [Candidatus Krumholzibacteria bacterium]
MEIANQSLKVREFIEEAADSLEIEVLGDALESSVDITVPEVSRPGFVLTGFTEKYQSHRIQVLGGAEFSYLERLSRQEVEAALQNLFCKPVPCFVITRGETPPEFLLDLANEHGIPLLRTSRRTTDFVRSLGSYLADSFSPRGTMHGSLVDVYGVGLLFTGPSGIGKSEIALDLVERGHRLAADDVVHLIRRGEDVVIGRGDEFLKHFMELRGIGLIDIREMFGIRAIRIQKRVEVEVRLEIWEEGKHYDRTGLEYEKGSILG